MIEECRRISKMNTVFELPNNSMPTDQGNLRLYEFESVLHEELSELKQARQLPIGSVERFVALSDLLGDILVYTISEAARWGIPIQEVFHAIMNSQDSKLVDGKPLKAPDGSKFIKGPNYRPPEPDIKEIIQAAIIVGAYDHDDISVSVDHKKPDIFPTLEERLANEVPEKWE